MQYSIIYSCDVPRGTSLAAPPPEQCHKWQCTERSGGPDGAQIEWGFEPGSVWSRGRHRKYCAWLDTDDEFSDFVDYCGLLLEDVETMGSIGAPGFGFGWAPALSFRSDDPERLQSAYVTPIPDEAPPVPLDDAPALPGCDDVVLSVAEAASARLWSEIRERLLEEYS